MILAHNDWEAGHSPVTLGRAPWLPAVYAEGVHEVASVVRRCNAEARMRADQRRSGLGLS